MKWVCFFILTLDNFFSRFCQISNIYLFCFKFQNCTLHSLAIENRPIYDCCVIQGVCFPSSDISRYKYHFIFLGIQRITNIDRHLHWLVLSNGKHPVSQLESTNNYLERSGICILIFIIFVCLESMERSSDVAVTPRSSRFYI